MFMCFMLEFQEYINERNCLFFIVFSAVPLKCFESSGGG